MRKSVILILLLLSSFSASAQALAGKYYIGNNLSIGIPYTLKLRDTYCITSTTKGTTYDTYRLSYDYSGQKYTFAPENSDLYARIIIEMIADAGVSQYDVKSLTPNDLAKLDVVWEQSVAQMLPVVKWYPTEKCIIGGKYVLVSRMVRQGLSGNVMVVQYKYYSTFYSTEITMSYRISESYIWKSVIDNVAKTLSF